MSNLVSAGNLTISNNLIVNGSSTLGSSLLCERGNFESINTDDLTIRNNVDITQGLLTTNDLNVNGTGVFILPPKYAGVLTDDDELVNKKYCDDKFVSLEGTQELLGLNTFIQSPIIPDVSLNDVLLSKAINKKYCDEKVAYELTQLISAAPEQLNTLNELAAAIGNDPSFNESILSVLATKAPLNSPQLTGVPISTTPLIGDNSTKIATTSFVSNTLNLVSNTLLFSPTTYYVSKLGDDIYGIGSIQRPFLTVQKALNVGNSSSATEFLVCLDVGNYVENLTITKNCTITGLRPLDDVLYNVPTTNQTQITGTITITQPTSIAGNYMLTKLYLTGRIVYATGDSTQSGNLSLSNIYIYYNVNDSNPAINVVNNTTNSIITLMLSNTNINRDGTGSSITSAGIDMTSGTNQRTILDATSSRISIKSSGSNGFIRVGRYFRVLGCQLVGTLNSGGNCSYFVVTRTAGASTTDINIIENSNFSMASTITVAHTDFNIVKFNSSVATNCAMDLINTSLNVVGMISGTNFIVKNISSLTITYRNSCSGLTGSSLLGLETNTTELAYQSMGDLNMGSNSITECSSIQNTTSSLDFVTTKLNMPSSITINTNKITSSSYASKTLGTANVLVATFTMSPYFKKVINLSSPISLYRQYKNVSSTGTNIIRDTLNSVTYTINKNGSVFLTGTCITNNTLPNSTIVVTNTASTATRSYEVYITNASVSFTPTESSLVDVYQVYYTMNNTSDTTWQSSNFVNLAFGYNINGTQATATLTPNTGTYGANFSAVSYSMSSISSYLTNNSVLYLNEVVANNINTQYEVSSNKMITNEVITNTTTTNTINSSIIFNENYIVSKKLVCGYFFDGANAGASTKHPIFGSTATMYANADDYWIIEPGYKFVFYNNNNYDGTGLQATIINTNSTEPLFISSVLATGTANAVNSVKVYFKDVEQTIAGLS